MNITVVGAGYVGLVTGTCLAESGNHVVCVDIDAHKVATLRRGEIPIYEPGLKEIVERNVAVERLAFTTDLTEAVPGSDLIFLAVGTPPQPDGSANLSFLFQAIDEIAPLLSPHAIVITKSTVPVGVNSQIHARLCELTGRDVDVASNPEFLKEGAAISDFQYPDRVIIGVRRPEVAKTLQRLFAPFLRTDKPLLVMSPESAEMTKYVANAMLATKISFINEMANVCERLGADINDVRKGIGHDRRIGFQFLFPGVGFGGSCFPKDVLALADLARGAGVEPRMIDAVAAVNDAQKLILLEKLHAHFGPDLAGRTLAIWGLAFKPRTDDIREAPALALIDQLLAAGVNLRVNDPVAMDNVERKYGDQLAYFRRPLEALAGADALLIMTEWDEYRHPSFRAMRESLATPLIFDGRNLYEPADMADLGFTYYSIGRRAVGLG